MKRGLLCVMLACAAGANLWAAADLTVGDLKVCSLTAPLALDRPPALSWVVTSTAAADAQKAYRIVVGTDRAAVARHRGDVWDSGRVASAATLDVPLAADLADRTTYWWSVQVESEQGGSAWSAPARFGTGIQAADWRAGWIGLDTVSNRVVTTLRREFQVKGAVKEAKAYICGLGLFTLAFNGQPVDDAVLNPYMSQYDKSIYYHTYDVTPLLVEGANAVGVELGHAFWNETGGVWNWPKANWRDGTKLLFRLEIAYADGTREALVSDTSWKATLEGPIRSDSVYYGETYDARRTLTGFSKAGYDDSSWAHALKRPAPSGRLTPPMKAPVRRVARLRPASVKKLAAGTWLVESPEMVAGWCRLSRIRGQAGHRVSIAYAQKLTPEGALNTKNTGTVNFAHWYPHAPFQTDVYLCAGTGEETYEPQFTTKGFHYIQITGYDGELTADDVEIFRVSNDVKVAGSFTCSNALVNRLHANMVTAMTDNFHGERCDPMLEKTAWLGDANVSLDCLAYNYDFPASFIGGLFREMLDNQEKFGFIPPMLPNADWNVTNHVTWNSLFAFGLQSLEDAFGIQSLGVQEYAALKRYIDFNLKLCRDERQWTWCDGELCDWVSPVGGSDPHAQYNEAESEGSAIVGTAMVYGVLGYAERLARRLGETSDAETFAAARAQIFAAFNARFYKDETASYETGRWRQIGTRTRYRQTSSLVALAFGLVPQDKIAKVVDALVADVRAKNDHLDTGCVGTRYILPILSNYGHADLAWRVVTQTSYPSWGFMIANKALSTWEMWEYGTRSEDHYFLGTYDEWFYSHLAGIRDMKNGYETFAIKPLVVGDMKFAEAKIDTVRGRVASAWKRLDDGRVELKVEIPFGSTAEVTLPLSQKTQVLKSGCYTFVDMK